MKVKIAVVTLFAFAAIVVLQSTPLAQETVKTSTSVWSGVYTKEQAKRGEALYSEKCSSCHGPDLGGNDEASPLSGLAFLSNWDGLTVGDLSERVRVSMPPNKVGTLNKQQIVDVLSYVLSVNSFPDGKTELDPKVEIQKQVKIEASKPKAHAAPQPGSFSFGGLF